MKTNKWFRLTGLVLASHLILVACQPQSQTADSLAQASPEKAPAISKKPQKEQLQERLVVGLTADGYELQEGEKRRSVKGRVPEGLAFAPELYAPKDYVFKASDVQYELKQGYVVKIGKDFYFWPKGTKAASPSGRREIPGVTVATSDGFLLDKSSKILSRTKDGIVVDHDGHAHFIFYSDLVGTTFAHLIPKGASLTSPESLTSSAGASVAFNGSTAPATADSYVFNPADIVAEDALGYTVRHGDHFHYILKSSLGGAYSGGNGSSSSVVPDFLAGDNLGLVPPGLIQPAHQALPATSNQSVAGLDRPTSDGFLFDGSGIVGWTSAGLLVDHGGHLHVLLTSDLINSKWAHLVPGAGQATRPGASTVTAQPAPSQPKPSPSAPSASERPQPNQARPSQPAAPQEGDQTNEQSAKAAYLAAALGLSPDQLVVLDSPSGPGFLYPHGDHHHFVLLSELDVTKPFDAGHDDHHEHHEEEASVPPIAPAPESPHGKEEVDPSSSVPAKATQPAVETEPTKEESKPDPAEPAPQPPAPAGPVSDEVASKRAYLAEALSLSPDQLVVLDSPSGPGFLYPHGDHHHFVLLSELDVTKPFDVGHDDHHDHHEEEATVPPSAPAEVSESPHGKEEVKPSSSTPDKDVEPEVAAETTKEESTPAPAEPAPQPPAPAGPVSDEVASKRAYLAEALGLSPDQLVVLASPSGPGFLYPHGDHHHFVLLSELDVTKPFDVGHDDHDEEETAQVDGQVAPVATDQVDSSDQALDAKIENKIATIMRKYGLERDQILVDRSKNAIIYPHGNHHHAEPIDEKKPFSGGHSHEAFEIFNPEEGVEKKTGDKVFVGEELDQAIALLRSSTFNNQSHTLDRGQKRVSFVFNPSIDQTLGTNVHVRLVTPDGKVFEKLSGNVFGQGIANIANFELGKAYLPGETFTYTISSKDYPEVSYSGQFAVNKTTAFEMAKNAIFAPFYAGDKVLKLTANQALKAGTEALVRIFDDFHGEPYLENNYKLGPIVLPIPEKDQGTTKTAGNTIPVTFMANPYEWNESSYVIDIPILERLAGEAIEELNGLDQPVRPELPTELDNFVDPAVDLLQEKLQAFVEVHGVGLDSLIFHPDGRIELRLPTGESLPVDLASLVQESPQPPAPATPVSDEVAPKRAYLAEALGLSPDQLVVLDSPSGPGFLYPHGDHHHFVLLSELDVTKPFDAGHGHRPAEADKEPSQEVALSEHLAKQRELLAQQFGLPLDRIGVVTADGKVIGFEYPHDDHMDFIPVSDQVSHETSLSEADKKALTAYIRKAYGLLQGTPVTFHDQVAVFAIPHPHQDYDANRDYVTDELDPLYDPGHVHPYSVPLDRLRIPEVTGIPEVDFENELLAAAERLGISPHEVSIKDGKYFVLPGKDHDHYLNILTPAAGYESYLANKLPDIRANFQPGDLDKARVLEEVASLLEQAATQYGKDSLDYRRIARSLATFEAELNLATTSTQAYLEALKAFDATYIKGEEVDTQEQASNPLQQTYQELTEQVRSFSPRVLAAYGLTPEGLITQLKSALADQDAAALTAMTQHLAGIARVEAAPSDLAPRLAYMDFLVRALDSGRLPADLQAQVADKVMELHQTPRYFKGKLGETISLKTKVAEILSEDLPSEASPLAPLPQAGFRRQDVVAYLNQMRDFVLKRQEVTPEELAQGFDQDLPLFLPSPVAPAETATANQPAPPSAIDEEALDKLSTEELEKLLESLTGLATPTPAPEASNQPENKDQADREADGETEQPTPAGDKEASDQSVSEQPSSPDDEEEELDLFDDWTTEELEALLEGLTTAPVAPTTPDQSSPTPSSSAEDLEDAPVVPAPVAEEEPSLPTLPTEGLEEAPTAPALLEETSSTSPSSSLDTSDSTETEEGDALDEEDDDEDWTDFLADWDRLAAERARLFP